MCEHLRQQVGEMEVREAVARAVCPQEWGQSPPLWPLATPRPALLWLPSAGLTGSQKAVQGGAHSSGLSFLLFHLEPHSSPAMGPDSGSLTTLSSFSPQDLGPC